MLVTTSCRITENQGVRELLMGIYDPVDIEFIYFRQLLEQVKVKIVHEERAPKFVGVW